MTQQVYEKYEYYIPKKFLTINEHSASKHCPGIITILQKVL